MSDYDKIEKIFTGSWKYDREENMTAFMEAMGKTKYSIFKLRASSFCCSVQTYIINKINIVIP